MEKILFFIKKNAIAFLIGSFVLTWFTYMTFQGNECFDCKQTENYRPSQRSYGNGSHFNHK